MSDTVIVQCADCGRDIAVPNTTIFAWHQCEECHKEHPLVAYNGMGKPSFHAAPAQGGGEGLIMAEQSVQSIAERGGE